MVGSKTFADPFIHLVAKVFWNTATIHQEPSWILLDIPICGRLISLFSLLYLLPRVSYRYKSHGGVFKIWWEGELESTHGGSMWGTWREHVGSNTC